jgi:hypothetical protein
VDGARKPGFAESMKIDGKVFPGFPQKAMSHADIICCAFTEIFSACGPKNNKKDK